MKVQIKYRGQVLSTTIPNPTIGQFVTLTAGDTRISLYWDGKRFVLPQAHVVDTAQIVAAAVEEAQEDVASRDLPDWVYESRDPLIVTLREQSGPDYIAFQELRGAGAWQQALLMQEMRAERKARTGAGDDLEARVFAAYADHAANRKVPLPSQMELAQLGGDWEPSGEDIKLALELKGEEEWASTLVSEDAERADDWGFEKAAWMPDPIGQLLLHGGKETIPATPALAQAYQHLDNLVKQHGDLLDAAAWAHDYLYQHLGAVDGDLLADIMAITAKADALARQIDQARAAVKRLEQRFGGLPTKLELPIVLANIADQWAGMTAKQRALVKQVMPETKAWEEVAKGREGKRAGTVLKRCRRIFTLWERSQMADVQDFVAEALDQWENRRAANDELAHPDGDEPKVEVALDNQTRFLEWVAQGALNAAAEATDIKADKAKKPWLGRPTYLVVLDSALKAGANINQAKNRAYAADTLRLPDRVLDCTGTGFRVKLNGKGQEGVVPFEDARLAFPHLPAAAKARLKQVHGMVQ
ncbi:MAG: hypothetical protein WA040_21400 [Anaerolineae bacterium]